MIAALVATLIASGLYAPPSAANVLAVRAVDAAARPAAAAILRQLNASTGTRGIALEGDPAAGDCAGKPYAAAAEIATTTQRDATGWYFDVGLILVDCAGWGANEWHNALELARPPSDEDAEKLGMALLLRLRTWMLEHPGLARRLLTTGLAYDPATATPTYFYTLFKTNDGYMRAFVRPGGPAYVAGMRTNDIVDKLDGKFWWEYGTYQTQQRAYDGKPHTFELTRGKMTLRVALGEPYRP